MKARAYKLTARQKQILDVVHSNIDENGYAPSIREIGDIVGLASPSTVKHHLDTLEEMGLVARIAGHPRSIRTTSISQNADKPSTDFQTVEVPVTYVEDDHSPIPLVGRIAAGIPVTAEQNVEDTFSLPTRLTGTGQLFVLEVTGDSMIDEAICDGDYVVVRSQPDAENGTVVAAMIDGEATVKVLSKTPQHVWLLPRNDTYDPILADNATILGRVVTVIRAL